ISAENGDGGRATTAEGLEAVDTWQKMMEAHHMRAHVVAKRVDDDGRIRENIWGTAPSNSHTSRDAALQSLPLSARQTRLPYDLSLFHLCKVKLGKKSNASLCGVIAYVQRT
ncbi:unnamed protein product, partial [Prunus brigantina]